MVNVGILGSTGYAGQQLVWLLNTHPEVNIIFLSSNSYANTSFSDVYCNYFNFMQDKCINIQDVEGRLHDIDLLFIALPHGKSFDITKKALSIGVRVIDLGADFRLNSSDEYTKWYGLEHDFKDILNEAVYGLSELNRNKIQNASLIANPGCYPTASILALTPLLKNKLINTDTIIIDAKSGVSGAGRNASISSLFAECNESVKAYSVAAHRHTPEIEQELSKAADKDIFISFTPHLIPMNRGILATCYGTLIRDVSTEELYELYKTFYLNEYFVRVKESLPETRWVRGSNLCDIGVRVDNRTNRVIVVSAIDNLIKGAAGQAVQNMNIIFGFEESTGLQLISMAP